ncbi:MAG: hypothetical protein IJ612_05980 [Prevotella sp.]|nr:hypothetical protein [Prevotella sp.]
MKATEQTQQQIARVMKKVAEKFPATHEATLLTDIHLRVSQESGELRAYDDDDREITRCVVEQWIDNKDDHFYDEVASTLRKVIEQQKQLADNLSILKPYAFVLEEEDKEPVAELYVADGDTVIIDPDLMQDLDKDLNDFFENLMQQE